MGAIQTEAQHHHRALLGCQVGALQKGPDRSAPLGQLGTLHRCHLLAGQQIDQFGGIALGAHRPLQTDRDAAQLTSQQFLHVGQGQRHRPGEFKRAGALAIGLQMARLGSTQSRQFLVDVDRNADRTALGGEGPVETLANPPIGISTESVTTGGIELLHRAREPDRALLDQVEQIEALTLIALGEIDHQAQIRGDHLLFRPLPQAQDPPLDIAVVTGMALTSGQAAAFLQRHHRLHLATQGEFLLRSQKLMAADLAEKGTEGTCHVWTEDPWLSEARIDWCVVYRSQKGFRVRIPSRFALR